jgi:capsular polysaccharide biosynthesis protein
MALALAAISGLVLGVGSAFALEFLNVTIKHEDDVERFLEVPVLATIRQF